MLTRLRKKSLSMPIDKSATQLDALCAIIGPRGYILLPPNFAILSPQKTFSAACYAWRFRWLEISVGKPLPAVTARKEVGCGLKRLLKFGRALLFFQGSGAWPTLLRA